jgi:hypothetical protein
VAVLGIAVGISAVNRWSISADAFMPSRWSWLRETWSWLPETGESSAASSNESSAATSIDSASTITKKSVPTRKGAPVTALTSSGSGAAGVADQELPTQRSEPQTVSAANSQDEGLASALPLVSQDAPAVEGSVSDFREDAIDQTIYSAQDADVQPPRILSDTLPGPTISAWTTRINTMEVIVSDSGAVERVRLVTPPQRMPDTFELTVAKLWKFAPAMKDGRPVRYRLVLTWEVNP